MKETKVQCNRCKNYFRATDSHINLICKGCQNNIKKEGIKITEENIEIIRHFVNFELYKNINDKEKWKKGELWFRNPRYPREYKKKINALIKVKEIIDLEYQWYLAIIKREEEKEIEEKTLKEY